MNMNKLVIQDDEGKTTVVPLIREEITIGRKEGNTIRLTERNVSRRHARILRSNGHVAIEDLNSYNGVRVNGSRIQGRCQLSLSDRVQIGDYLIELKSDEAAAGYNDQKTQPIERVDPMLASGQHEPTAVVAVQNMQAGAPASMPAATPQPGTVPPVHAPPSHPTAVIGLADTDPGAHGVQPGVSAHGRMVVLSTNFAGREWELNKPVMVIGRTDENDIVINHRSISRNHAKITLENGRYSIADLNSSNGVRINGEEYGKVELRRGDMIDLGHVRMRFVEPGEDFLFGRDAVAMDVGGRRGPGLWIAIGGGLLAIVVLVFALRGGGDDDKQASEKADKDRPVTKPDKDPGKSDPVKPDGPKTNDPVAATSDKADDEVTKWLDQAQKALDNREWQTAKDLAGKALAKNADSQKAKQIKTKAELELKNQKVYDKFVGVAKDIKRSSRYDLLVTLFKRIDDESVYKELARPKHDEIRNDYVDQVRKVADKMAKRKQCARIAREAKKAAKLWEEAERVWNEALDECNRIKNAVATNTPNNDRPRPRNPKPRNPKPKNGNNGTTNNGTTNNGATSGLSANQLAAQARNAVQQGQWGKGLLLCQKALAKSPNHQESVTVCAFAACMLRNKAQATRYMNKMRAADRRAMARSICLRNGVQVQ